MSDPVTNVEIEDVLSSIRRLVSSESRDTIRTDHAESAPAAESAQKLVLTPSFRVDEAAADARADSDTKTAESAEDDRDWDAVDAQPESRGPDTEDDGDWDQVESEDAETAEADTPEPDVQDSPADTLKARVAEMEQVVARSTDQWEPDGDSDDDYAGGPVDPLPWEDYVPSETGGDADGATETDAAKDTETDAAPDVAEPAAEAVETETATPPPAPEQADDEQTSDTLDEEAETPMPEGAESEDRLEADNFLAGDADDAILDEDALRELVTEIVRQELQGGLGERITRNVRKLVRREIHRALASQELE